VMFYVTVFSEKDISLRGIAERFGVE